jgi:hypothetical protein
MIQDSFNASLILKYGSWILECTLDYFHSILKYPMSTKYYMIIVHVIYVVSIKYNVLYSVLSYAWHANGTLITVWTKRGHQCCCVANSKDDYAYVCTAWVLLARVEGVYDEPLSQLQFPHVGVLYLSNYCKMYKQLNPSSSRQYIVNYFHCTVYQMYTDRKFIHPNHVCKEKL